MACADTPQHWLSTRIAREGPLGIDGFMAAALGDPVHGYYRIRDPLGAAGDFVTAPEVSQIFGEIVGAWALDTWTRIAGRAPLRLIELGPGRGTLLADALRILSRLRPGAPIAVDLVETSPVLRRLQQTRLAGFGVELAWHERLETVPGGSAIFIANEFFDALPIRQFVRQTSGWAERLVGLGSEGACEFIERPVQAPPDLPEAAEPGEVYEVSAVADAIASAIGRRLAAAPGAALVIDYGHLRSACGDTLQAVRAHTPVPVLDRPGSADLTAHVDFEALADAFRAAGAAVVGPVTQRAFLLSLGAGERARRLAQDRSPGEAGIILAGLERLIDAGPDGRGMGSLFKAMAAVSPGLPALAGFA